MTFLNQPDVINIMEPLFNTHEFDDGKSIMWSLPDAIYCKASSGLNGNTTLVLHYPVSGVNAEQIFINRLIVAKINKWQQQQVMRIYSVKKTLSKAVIEVKAEHVTNDIRQFSLPWIDHIAMGNNWTSQETFNFLEKMSTPVHDAPGSVPSLTRRPFPIIFVGDPNFKIPNGYNWKFRASTLLEVLGGVQGSILDVCGGEYERDNQYIRHKKRLGEDLGYRIEYGLNMTEVEFTTDLSNTYYGVLPFVQYTDSNSREILITLPENYTSQPFIHGNNESPHYYGTGMLGLDLSDKLNGEATTQVQLKEAAITYVANNQERFYPSVNMKVNFVTLDNKKEYEQFQVLKNLKLGDDVQVTYQEFGLDVKTRMISYEYDVITQQYTKVELGQPKLNFIKQMESQYDVLYKKAFGIRTIVKA